MKTRRILHAECTQLRAQLAASHPESRQGLKRKQACLVQENARALELVEVLAQRVKNLEASLEAANVLIKAYREIEEARKTPAPELA